MCAYVCVRGGETGADEDKGAKLRSCYGDRSDAFVLQLRSSLGRLGKKGLFRGRCGIILFGGV